MNTFNVARLFFEVLLMMLLSLFFSSNSKEEVSVGTLSSFSKVDEDSGGAAST